ncbi:MAG: phage tail family protein [Anaerolineae bacterium]
MEYEGAAVYRAVRARLTAETELWGTRAYAELAPEGTIFPYLVYALRDIKPLPGPTQARAVMISITAVTDDLGVGLSAAGRIAALLDGFSAAENSGDWAIRACMRSGGSQKTGLVDAVPQHEISLHYRMILDADTPVYTRAVRFGDYAFPAPAARLRDNFAATTVSETPLPGRDGAWIDGERTPQGRIEVMVPFEAGDAARDALHALSAIGWQELVIEPSGMGGESAQRSTLARLIAIDLQADDLPQAVLTFAAETPRWFGVTDPAGSGTAQTCSGAVTEFTRTANGSATAYPTITITAITNLSGIAVQRMVANQPADQIVYAAGLSSGDVLTIDTRALTITLNGADAYGSVFNTAHPAWFRLLPGANVLRAAVGVGETASVTIDWRDTWV